MSDELAERIRRQLRGRRSMVRELKGIVSKPAAPVRLEDMDRAIRQRAGRRSTGGAGRRST